MGSKWLKTMAPGGPYSTHFLKVVPVSLKKFHMNAVKPPNMSHANPEETCCEIDEKLTFDLLLALFGFKKAPKIWPRGAILYLYTHTWKHPICLWTKFDCFIMKNVLKNCEKLKQEYKNQIFTYIWLSKFDQNPNQNSNCTGFWAILLCTFKPNIGKVQKTEGDYSIWKKKLKEDDNDGRTPWHWISSAEYDSSGFDMKRTHLKCRLQSKKMVQASMFELCDTFHKKSA